MAQNEFPEINRGNGVMNDNLATLGDIMKATLQKVCDLEDKMTETKNEVTGVKKTIQDIDKENTPREKKNFWLLVASVVIGLLGLLFAYLFRK